MVDRPNTIFQKNRPVFFVSICELDFAWLPNYFHCERDFSTFFQFDFMLRSQLNINDLVVAVTDFEFFVCPNTVLFFAGFFFLFFMFHFSYNAPDRQIVHVHLEPVMIVDCITQLMQNGRINVNFAIRLFGFILQKL